MSRGNYGTPAVRRSRILMTSFGVSIGAVILLALVLVFSGATAEAANTCVLSNTSGPVNWSNPAKWSSCGGVYPNAGDTAQVGLSGGYTLVVDVPVNVNLQLQTSGFTGLDVSNSLQLEASSTSVSGANITINSGGKLRVAPSANLTTFQANLTLNNGGTIEMQTGSSYLLGSGASFVFAGGTMKGPGTFNIPVGTPIALTGANGAMTMDGGLILTNLGTINLVSSTNALSVNSGTQINNQSGATFNLSTNVPIATDNLSAPAINNSGNLYATSIVSPTVNVPVNNNSGGLIQLQETSAAQTLTLAGGGTHTGSFSTSSPTVGTIAFNGAHNFNSGWAWNTGPSSVFKIVGGTATVNTPFVTPYFTQTGGTLTGPGNVTVSSNLDWQGGTETGTGATTVNGLASITGTSSSLLDGRTISVSGGTFTINPSSPGNFTMNNVAQVSMNGGSIDLQSDIPIASDGTGVFNITGGTLTKSTGTKTTVNSVLNINGIGTIQPVATTIEFGNGGSVGGTSATINTSTAGSAIQFNGGTTTLGPGTVINSGDFLLSGGVLKVTTPLTIATMTQSNLGILKGTATLTVGNTFNWTGGTMDGDTGGTGVLAIASPNGIANINGSLATKIFHRFTFANGGTVHYLPTVPLGADSGAQITNSGTWSFENGTALTSDLTSYLATSPAFTNTGVLQKTIAGTTSFGLPFKNNGGAVTLGSAADLELTGGGTITGGSIAFTNPGDILGIQTNVVTIAAAPTVTGAGFLRVNNLGTLFMGATTTVPNFALDNLGTLDGTLDLAISTAMKWSGGTMTGGGNTTLLLGATGDMSVLNGAPTLNNRTFANNGTITLGNAFPLAFTGSGHFTNNGSGILNITGPTGTSTTFAGNTFVNSGTINRTTTSGFYTFDLPFTNSGGTVDVQVANSFVDFQGGGSMSSGVLKGSVGTSGVEFSNNTFNVTGGNFGTVGGLKINGVSAILNINTTTNAPANLALVTGTLASSTAGTLTMPSGSTANLNGGTVQNVTLAANSGGFINFDTTGAPVNLDGATIGYNGGSFGQWIGGNLLQMSNGASIVDAGTVTWGGSGNVSTGAGATPTITVNTGGILQKTTSASPIGVAANLQNNGGTITSQTGALQLNYSGASSHTGTFNTSGGASIVFGGNLGSNTFNTGTSGTGAGILQFSGGTDTFTSPTTLTNLQLDQATMSGAGPLTFTGTFDWNGGSLNVPTLNSGGTLNLNGSLGNMSLGANLTSGANFSSTSGNFVIGSGVTYTNNGTFDITTGAQINGLGTFTNTGTLTRSAGSGTAMQPATFNNNGIVNVNTGSLNIFANGTDTGTYNCAASVGFINFQSGTRTLTSTAIVGAGALGSVAFIGGTTTVNGTYTPAGSTTVNGGAAVLNTVGTATTNTLTMMAGSLSGSSAFKVNNSGTWGGGTISGSGSFTIPVGATLIIQPTSATILNGRTLTNAGTITLDPAATQTLEMDNGAAIVNQSGATFDMQNDPGIFTGSGASSFSNAGTLLKSAGNSVEGFDPALTNTGTIKTFTGTLLLNNGLTQTAGSTQLLGGAISSPMTLSYTGGTLIGAGSINAALTNSGATIDPGNAVTPGNITVNGTFNQTAGALVTDLFANNSNDKLVVPLNTATVGGNLNVQLVSPYVPASGDSFTVINAGTLTDTTTKSYPAYGPNNTGTFTPTVTGTTLSLAAFIPVADVSVFGTTAPATVVHTNTWSVNIPVMNFGPDGATGIAVTVTPTNGTLTSLTTSQGSCVGTTCTVGSLSNGGSATITASITATTLPSVSASVSVTANETDSDGTNNTKSVSATVTPLADLSLVITDAPDPVNAGGTVTYTYQTSNAGPDAATANVSVSISSGSNSGVSAGCSQLTSTTASCSTNLAPSGVQSFTINVTAPGAGPINASGTVTASGATDQNAGNNSAAQSTTVIPQADLKIIKSGPASVSAGSNIVYTITVTNLGPSDASSVLVNDPTPAGLTFVSNSGACTGAFPCSIGSLTNGTSATITATYSTSPSAAPTTVVNSATVSAATADPANGNNSSSATTVIGQNADLSVAVSAPSSTPPGSTFTVTVTVTNNGPSTASGVILSSSHSAGLSFVSNTGACTTSYPCNLGTLNSGQSVQVITTYTANSGGVTNTATFTASSAITDANNSNDSATATITTNCPTGAPTNLTPAVAGVPATGTLSWNDVGAASYNIYLGPAGGGCTTLYATRSMGVSRTTQVFYSLNPGTQYEWAVEAVTPGCPTLKSSCVTFTTATNCAASAPQPISPAGNAVAASPVTFTWTASAGATLYTVKNAADDSVLGTSTTTSLGNVTVPDGAFTWYVVADVPQCGQLRSGNATFNGCSIPPAPIVGAVSQAASGQTYAVQWDRIAGAASYDLEEATNEGFTNTVVTTIPQPATGNLSVPFTKSTSQGALVFFYRVRVKSLCAQAFGPYSIVVRVVVLPPPPKTQKNPNVTVPVGSTLVVVQQVFVPGINDGVVHTFVATVDKPWLTVDPASGILPADGVTLNVKTDPANLPNGTETGTVIVTISTASGKTGSNGSTVVTVPVSVNLVTPVTPSSKDLPPDNTLVIPSVGHLDGVNSHWQSDIRLANTGSQKLQYALKFSPADPSLGGVKTTTITVDGGGTTALDDIVRNWYGIGTLGESANGVLEVRPLTPSGKGLTPNDAPSVSKVTVVSSRTYTISDAGTLGQFIPAIPFSSFIGKAAQQAAASVLSLQQIAQSDQYRTNVGIVEGSGQPASVLLSVFDVSGKKLKDVPLSLKAGQQLQLGSFLASVGIPSLSDGRIEVKVTGGEGRVTAYASVVDNLSLDPLLVSGVKLGAASANNYVLPGVADINTGLANWRTDMRIFNGGSGAQNALLTFYPQGGSPLAQSIVINAGEIRTLDSVVQALFGITNAGGAVHVTTSGNSNLIVSGRTYNATSAGTFGQFIPAVTAADSIASGDRALQILQAEDSVRYRTNIGLAEVDGKAVGVDVSINLPDSKVTPVVHVDLAPNDFQQFNVFRALGLDNIYNARVSIRVTDGGGRVTAYGSVVDMLTSDPTYVPAQQ